MKHFVKRFAAFVPVFTFLLSLVSLAGDASAGNTTPPEMKRTAPKAARAATDGFLLKKEEEIQKIAEKKLDEYIKNYAKDHAPLSQRVKNDLKIEDLYDLLASAGALSFPAANATDDAFKNEFQKIYPGYEGRRSAINFGEAYKDLMDRWQDYSFGTLNANNKEALNLKELAGKLNDLDLATTSSLGYIQILQARNQIKFFMAREAVNLRLDILRQIEARARHAAERQQKNTDRQVAFDKAVNIWKSQSSKHKEY